MQVTSLYRMTQVLMLLIASVFAGGCAQDSKPVEVKVVVMAMFERGLCEVDFCSMEIAGDRPSMWSTSGFSIIERNCLA